MSIKMTKLFETDDRIELNRLNIVGKINEYMPACVLMEVATSLRIDISKELIHDPEYIDILIKTLSTITQVYAKPFNLTTKEAPNVARYINGNSKISWHKEDLLKAYDHLNRYYKVENPPMPEDDFVFGYKTPETPLSYDACMLYSICKYIKAETTRLTTIEEMAEMVTNRKRQCEEIRKKLISVIECMTHDELLSSYIQTDSKKLIQSKTDIKIDSISAEAINKTHLKITSVNHLIGRIDPKTHIEAILLSVYFYGINLTKCVNPIKEFTAMRKCKDVSEYIPVADDIFKLKYLINPVAFNVTKCWESSVQCIYSDLVIKTFAEAAGYDISLGISYLEFLSIAEVTETFHLGVHPNSIINLEPLTPTMISLDDPKELGYSNIITYGISDIPSSLIYHSVQDLIGFFTSMLKFVVPGSPHKIISKSAIKKLKNICVDNQHTTSSVSLESGDILTSVGTTPPARMFRGRISSSTETDEERDYKKLYDVIVKIEKMSVPIGRNANQLRTVYKEYKSDIDKYMKLFLELAMYMRGWMLNKNSGKVKSEFPLLSSDTLVSPDDQEMIIVNTTQAIHKFEHHVNSVNSELKDILEGLPLMRRFNSDGDENGVFTANTCKDEGITIMDRLKIVKDDTSENACIRMTSNHYLMSVFFYTVIVLGNEEPFDVKKISEIS
jgi:hypothetical protein